MPNEPIRFLFTVTPQETCRCAFSCYTKMDGHWNLILFCSGFLGRSGICLPEQKREGDGCTPAGYYSLGTGFGLRAVPGCPDYHIIGPDDYWDCDCLSPTYNRMVRGSAMPPQWNRTASEHLASYPGLYDFCIPILYNSNPAVPGKGSAIFLHCMQPETRFTAGCVAIPPNTMRNILPLAQHARIVLGRTAEELTRFGIH